MVIGARPALTISSTSSSSSSMGASTITTGGLPCSLNLAFRLLRALGVDAPLADEHLLAGQIVHGGNRRRARAGDHHFVDIGAGRVREGDEFLALGRDGHHRGDHVDQAADEGRVELVALHRHQHHVHLEVPGLQVLVELALEQLRPLVGDPALLPLVDEVVRAVEGHADADRAPLDHLVEVASERLPDDEPRGFRKRVVRRRGWRNWLVAARRRGRRGRLTPWPAAPRAS